MFKPLERKAAPLRRAIDEFHRIHQQQGGGNGAPAEAPSPNPADAGPLVRPPEGRTAARGSWTPEPPPAASLLVLRPPGALPEEQFTSVCSRCEECVRVCPARCIRIEPGGRGGGAPFIDVDTMPCVLCDGLLCMNKCPSGALLPTPLAEIRMGTAEWNETTCVRSRREECTTCVDQCPIGPAAIELLEGRVQVHPDGCVGCGVCEHYCPTVPKSIRVKPRG
jgi:ferredoxin-type protein NapG